MSSRLIDRYKHRVALLGVEDFAQNPNGADHSTFLSFAPKNNPKIAISVYVEHGGFGAEIALPIASLIEELYLTDTITRPDMVQKVLNFTPKYSRNYDAKQRAYDMKREEEQRKKQKK